MLFSRIKWQIGILDISDLLNRRHITQKGVPGNMLSSEGVMMTKLHRM
jgi:hypothetical protein